MDQKQFEDLIKQVQSGLVVNNPDTRSAIDKAIPLPVGSKSITGLLGTVISVGSIILGAVPPGEWMHVAEVFAGGFVTLAGSGFFAKWQRQINIAEEGLKATLALVQAVQKQSAPPQTE